MFRFMKYGPYICIGVVLAVLFVLWAFWGGKKYDFIGLAPLSPETCGSYTGSLYNWGNITPATGYDPIEGHDCVSPDAVRVKSSQDNIVVDNTPSIPPQFRDNKIGEEISEINNSGFNDESMASEVFSTNDISFDNNVSNVTPICPQEISTKNVQVPLILDYDPRQNIKPQETAPTQVQVPLILDYDPRQQNNIRPPLQSLRPPVSSKGYPMILNKRGRFISKGERMCCQTMERIYGVKFKSTWPDWLRNPETGDTLELDCYNDDLKIAVEYNGEQHYKWPNFTNQTYEKFINQVRRDTLKLDLCDKNGVYLIVVPYNVPHENIPSYIMSHLPETIQKRIQEENTLSNILM